MKKQIKHVRAFKRTTTVFGYGLFGLQILALLISTIVPLSSLLFSPGVRHFNVVLFAISLTAATILPSLVSYILGHRATQSAVRSERRFNGILFGLASYWISEFFGLINSNLIASIRNILPEPLATIVIGWPILATIAAMAFVAVIYTKSQKKQSSVLLANKSFQIALFAGLIATIGYFLANNNYDVNTLLVSCLLYIGMPSVLLALSYGALPASSISSKAVRLTMAGVAVSIGFIASSIAAQLLTNATNAIPQLIIGGIALATYLLLARGNIKYRRNEIKQTSYSPPIIYD